MIYEDTNWELIKSIVSTIIEEKCDGLSTIQKLQCVFNTIANNKDSNDYKIQYLQFYLYKNYTEKSVRDRKVTARNFEDFISLILDTKPTDSTTKGNPTVSDEIQKLQKELNPNRFSIVDKLSSNKREKSDTFVLEDGTNISIKTLKGATNYNKSIGKDKVNTEINIGSLCYESTFYKLITDLTFNNLSDRTKGLGSAPQLMRIIFYEVFILNKYDDFRYRLKIFLDYLYRDDFYFIAFKSDYQMHIYQFGGDEFVDLFIDIIDNSIEEFKKIQSKIDIAKIDKAMAEFDNLNKKKKTLIDIVTIINKNTNNQHKVFVDSLVAFFSIFYRWENNNLRIQIDKLIDNSVWTSTSMDDIVNIETYFNKDIKNPFRKENLIVLDFQHLNDSEIVKKIDKINSEYLRNIKKEVNTV